MTAMHQMIAMQKPEQGPRSQYKIWISILGICKSIYLEAVRTACKQKFVFEKTGTLHNFVLVLGPMSRLRSLAAASVPPKWHARNQADSPPGQERFKLAESSPCVRQGNVPEDADPLLDISGDLVGWKRGVNHLTPAMIESIYK